MKAIIKAIGVYVPSNSITTDQFVEQQLDASTEIKRYIRKYFQAAQGKSKPWPNENETPVFMLREAFADAMKQADLNLEDIDLVLYSGVIKGVIEPGQAHVTASDLGLKTAHCFDVAEACISWVRSLEIAEFFVNSGRAKNVVIVSAISHRSYACTGVFTIAGFEEIDYKFAALTVGAAATVTIISASDESDLNLLLIRESDTGAPEECGIFTHDYPFYCGRPMKEWQAGRFLAKGSSLYQTGRQLCQNILKKANESFNNIDIGKIIITHSVGKSSYDEIFLPYPELAPKHYNIYPWSGNVGDSTIPLAIHDAISKGVISPNERISAFVNGSGSSCVFATFNLHLNQK